MFVHHSNIVNQSGYRTLKEGERVEFVLREGPKGLHAEEVRKLDETAETQAGGARGESTSA